MRLIDAEDSRKDFMERVYDILSDEPDNTKANLIIDAFDEAPTVEAKPIIHAKWVSSKIPDSMLSECSHCNFDCGAYSFEYCPHCGAKMDGEENESS